MYILESSCGFARTRFSHMAPAIPHFPATRNQNCGPMPFDEVNCVDENLAFLQTFFENGRNSPRRYPREKLSRPGNSTRQKPLRRQLKIRAIDRWTAWKAYTVIIFGWQHELFETRPKAFTSWTQWTACRGGQATRTAKKFFNGLAFGGSRKNLPATPEVDPLVHQAPMPKTCKNKQTGSSILGKHWTAHKNQKDNEKSSRTFGRRWGYCQTDPKTSHLDYKKSAQDPLKQAN